MARRALQVPPCLGTRGGGRSSCLLVLPRSIPASDPRCKEKLAPCLHWVKAGTVNCIQSSGEGSGHGLRPVKFSSVCLLS